MSPVLGLRPGGAETFVSTFIWAVQALFARGAHPVSGSQALPRLNAVDRDLAFIVKAANALQYRLGCVD